MNDPAPVRLGPAAAGRCRRRVHLDHASAAPRELRSVPDTGVKMRLTDMQAHSELTLTRLPDGPRRWSPSSSDRPAVVRLPELRTPTRVGAPDALILDGGGYLPVIIRGHRTLDPGGSVPVLLSPVDDPPAMAPDASRRSRRHPSDVLQLAHFHAMLTELGVAGRPLGGVIGRGDGDGDVILWHDLAGVLAEYADRFTDRLRVAAAAAAGGDLTSPSRIGECRRCSWWPVCSVELEARHDISLLAAGADVALLQENGIFSLDDLVATPTRELKLLPLSSVPPAEAKARAQAMLDGVPLVRRKESAAARRADVELDVDMESYLDAGAYLWGTLLSGADIGLEPGYRPFASFAALPGPGEAAAFAAFWAFLTQVRNACLAKGLTFAAYCWSRSAEERWMYSTPRRHPGAAGLPTEQQVAEFCSSAEWIDLFAEVKQLFVVPGSMRLKAIAPIAGFRWRDPEPGGENSMAWFRAAIGDPEVGDGVPDPVMQQRVLDYNEDDVRATAAIREWMSDGAQAMPTVDDLLHAADRGLRGPA